MQTSSDSQENKAAKSILPVAKDCRPSPFLFILIFMVGQHLAEEMGFDVIEDLQLKSGLVTIGAMLLIWTAGCLINHLLKQFGLQESARTGIWSGAIAGIMLGLAVLRFTGLMAVSQIVGIFSTVLITGAILHVGERLDD